jgi:SNF2 family DNA or RNA helicase
MIALHAGFYDDRLWVWGETPCEPGSRSQRGRKRKLTGCSPPPLPYDPGGERIWGALQDAGIHGPAVNVQVDTVIGWLPTLDNRPVASSPLISNPPDFPMQATLAPWQITALGLPAGLELEVLCACMGKEILAPGVIVGKDLRFWVTAMRFAGSLVAKQYFLPGMDEVNGAYYARWKPVLSGSVISVPAKLAQSMPQVCRALTREAASPPTTPAAAVLAVFINKMVDQLIRCTPAAPPEAVKPLRGRRPKLQKETKFDSLHDQWLFALQSPDGAMQGNAAELAQLAAQIGSWQRPISVTTTTPFRLCFRLEEPDEGAQDDFQPSPGSEWWYVRYLLQAVDDPSLLIPTADAWNAKGRTATVLQRGSFNIREYLLFALGQSAHICPNIESSLKTSIPGGYQLDSQGAFDFLTEKAMLLEQAGFGVMLPAWWSRRGTKLRLATRVHVKPPKMQGGSGLNLDQIIRFDWQLALGDETLSLKELQELVKLKSPLVKVRGQWVQLNAEEIRAALDFWKKKAAGTTTAREIIQMSLGGLKTPPAISFAGITAEGWIADLIANLQGQTSLAELPPPDDFCGTLRPYQTRGYSWLCFLRQWGLGACLADDMGLGKTVQTLALIARDWQSKHQPPVLLVCPTSVVGNWQKEAARFTPHLPVMVHHGAARTKGKALAKKVHQHAMVISSYALLHRDFEILKEIPWSGVILDEAQNIKNPETKQAKAARALKADYRLALTGTPVENNVGDLWSIMEFLNSGFLGTQGEFKRRFFIPIQANREVEAAQRLQRLTGPFILRRLKTDPNVIADLPDKNEMKIFCTLTKEQASLYAAVVQEATRVIEGADGIQRRGVILATLSKLKQVCNHPAQFLGDNSPIPGRSGKLARLTEMLAEILEVRDRALIFTQFTEMGGILRRHLQETFGREVLFLHGGVPKKQRDQIVERFQTGSEQLPIFLLSLKAGGTGLNLTGANHVFHFDRWWNPAVENQATDRAFRIGQTRDVQVHKFLCLGTLEEKIDEMIERKQEVAEKVVGAGEGWLTELSTAELKKLMALRQETLGE